MPCEHRVALWFLVSFVILETSILINLYFDITSVFPNSGNETPPSSETQRLFASYDTNADGVIDLREFEVVEQRINEALHTEANQDLWSEEDIDSKFEELKNTSGEILKLKTEFTSLVLDSMSKFSDGQDSSYDSMQALTGLRQWQNVFKHEAEFAVEAFKVFLPKRRGVDIGETWMVVTPNRTQFGPDLSSNRYVPPAVYGDHTVIHYLLQMFHPRPFMYSRFPPQGSVACIKAMNNEFLEIEFRIHAEYQLNKPPLFPFWFSPAQFSGRLVITRNGLHIQTFEMEVPNNHSLNVDMEWLTGIKKTKLETVETNSEGAVHDDNEQFSMEVDIGYLPKMKVHSMGQSYMLGEDNVAQNNKHDIIWDREISREEARSILEKRMYPFKEVPYLSFEKAYAKAKEEKKLVHSILLWGALDDQSC